MTALTARRALPVLGVGFGVGFGVGVGFGFGFGFGVGVGVGARRSLWHYRMPTPVLSAPLTPA
ncbi:hypothetical protein [Xanthomonas sp. Leaf148]|uniref:hypothetical protein n=1 Tax=Xanthomonas sp. Leaf148 TaxID=1736275 RepID=UPI000B31D325|nr:hypothetical protein [Xanthomonas sp. Leaf148]